MKGNGIGFGSILALILITLKLTNYINWNWLWILSPLWIPVVLVLLFFVTVFILESKE